jgi:signal transduction histidine kinase
MAEPTDVGAVVDEVLALERMAEGAVEWQVSRPDGVVVWAMARAPELRDVLLNLLENARQAGSTVVHVDVTQGDDAVRLEIRDDGSGIAPDVLFKVFEPHFSTRTSGSGLGLAISRRLVDGWGGSLAIDRSGPDGTVVVMTLRAVAGIGTSPAALS